jgi:hypothetical protein
MTLQCANADDSCDDCFDDTEPLRELPVHCSAQRPLEKLMSPMGAPSFSDAG